MGIVVTLKYLRQVGAGRWEYRRRVPESVKAITGQGEFKRVVQAHSDAALAREHAIVEAEFARMVADVKKAAPAVVRLTAREEWFAAQSRATELLAGVRGARDEDEARELLAENLPPSDVLTMKAVVDPDWKEPKPTLEPVMPNRVCILRR